MQVVGPTSGEDVLFLEIQPSDTIATLKSRIEFQSAIPPPKQIVQYNRENLQDDTKTLEQCQISPDSLLLVIVDSGQQPQRQGGAGPSQGNTLQRGQGQSGQGRLQDMSPEMIRQSYLSSPRDLANLRQKIPLLADVINDPKLWEDRWNDLQKRQKELQEQRDRDNALIESDPFDVEAQQRIEELIRLEQVEENFEQTREYHPEGELLSLIPSG